MTQHHVALAVCGADFMENGGTIGWAATAEEAALLASSRGYTVIPADNGGALDFYDAEDGPGVQGYEPDGCGVFIVTVAA
jgi:hypothetical protein